MLRIRLRRTGKKKQPSYRVVVADQRAPRDGAFVEVVGHYNPRTDPTTLELKEERVKYWLSQGAQPSETVHRLLRGQGLIDVEPPKRVTKPSKAELEAAAASETAAAEASAAAEAELAVKKAAESSESSDDAATPAEDAPAGDEAADDKTEDG